MKLANPRTLAAARAMFLEDGHVSWEESPLRQSYVDRTRKVLKAADEAASGMPGAVLAFINERPEYITAMENCHVDKVDDYGRWSGHAEARRQLAERLGYEAPNSPGETAVGKERRERYFGSE